MNTRQPSTLACPGPEPVAPNVNTLWARIIVDELARAGVEHAVISPGSRSAPLVFQFAAHPSICEHSVVDERSAAFFALGIARATHKAVALVCTTGTAAANYFPAVCEAERDRIPLLVLTGARPSEDHDCGVQQVMDQYRLYGEHVRGFHSPGQPEAAADRLAALRSMVARACALSLTPDPGPVHLDIPFRKPLEPVPVDPDHRDSVPAELSGELGRAVAGREGGQPWIRVSHARPGLESGTHARFVEQVRASRRPLIVAGADPRASAWREALDAFAELASIPVLAEPASGLRHWRERGRSIIAAGDLVAAGGFYAGHAPDLVVHLGRSPLTWALQRLMHDCAGAMHIAVADGPHLADPEHIAAEQIVCDPAELFAAATAALGRSEPAHGAWLAAHRRADDRVHDVLERCFADAPLSAPAAWHALAGALPENTALVCSSSMVVRDLDTFMCTAVQSLDIHFNRGLNGIDGVVSTALGIAAARRNAGIGAPTVLVIGDVALRHDIGALLLAEELDLDLTVIVIDNDGGEIFDYLPGAAFGETHERLFATRRGTSITGMPPRSIALVEPAGKREFTDAVAQSQALPGLQVIRVGTDCKRDQRLRAGIADRIRRALEAIPIDGAGRDS